MNRRTNNEGPSRGLIAWGQSIGLVVVVLALVPPASSGQTEPVAQIVEADADCEGCGLTATRALSIGTLEGPADLAGPPVAALGPDSAIWVATPFRGTDLKVFDREGRYVRSVGRSGQGPGEFSLIYGISSGARGVSVFDNGNRRVSVLGDDGRVVAEHRTPGETFDVIETPESVLILNGIYPTRNLAGLPLHVVAPGEDNWTSFGGGSGAFRRDLPALQQRVLAHRAEGGFWASETVHYRISGWSLNGRLEVQLERHPDWFEPHLGDYEPNRDTPPPPYVSALNEDPSGLLWVVAVVPDDQWYEGLGGGVSSRGVELTGVEEVNDYYDSIVEIIDPNEARVLASGRFDAVFLGFLSGTEVFSQRTDERGVPILDIWRLTREHEPQQNQRRRP